MARPENEHESSRLTFQVPKELKCELYEELKPKIKKKVDKWKAAQKREQKS
ncbi:MAG: hypothetical protein HRT87_01315 [Legionellales bacterium]|nr:hypothetical protein [Legionellales bacterium]